MKKKKGFTIIELIVVIAVLGILVLLAMSKFIGYNEKAVEKSIKADLKTVQTAVDMKIVDNQGVSPYKIKIGDAEKIDVTKLKPQYISSLKSKEGYEFWIDGWDTVFYTKLNPPENVKYNDGTLSWDAVENADEYKIYKIADKKEVSLLDLIGIKTVMADSGRINLEKKLYKTTDELSVQLPEGTYLVSAIDKKDESVPIGENYKVKENLDSDEKNEIPIIEETNDDNKFEIKMNDTLSVSENGSFQFEYGDWGYMGSNPIYITENKEFHTTGSSMGYYTYYLPTNLTIATFELTVKNLANGGGMNSSMFIRTNQSGIGFYFYPDKVEIYDDVFTSPIKTIYLNVTEYHTYRIVKNDGVATLYIDGEKVDKLTLRSGSGYGESLFFFGDGTSSNEDNSTYYKDIKIAPGKELYLN